MLYSEGRLLYSCHAPVARRAAPPGRACPILMRQARPPPHRWKRLTTVPRTRSWPCDGDRASEVPRRGVRLTDKLCTLHVGHPKAGSSALQSAVSRKTAARAHRAGRYPLAWNTEGAPAARLSDGNGRDLRQTFRAIAAADADAVPSFQRTSLARPAGRHRLPRSARPRGRAEACALQHARYAQLLRGRLLEVGPMRDAGSRPRGLRRLRSGSGDPDHAVRDDAGPGSRARPGGVRLHIRTAGRGGALPMPAAVPPAAVAAPARQPAHVPAQDQPPAGAQLLRARRPMAAARGRPYREDHGKERR